MAILGKEFHQIIKKSIYWCTKMSFMYNHTTDCLHSPPYYKQVTKCVHTCWSLWLVYTSQFNSSIHISAVSTSGKMTLLVVILLCFTLCGWYWQYAIIVVVIMWNKHWYLFRRIGNCMIFARFHKLQLDINRNNMQVLYLFIDNLQPQSVM